MSAFLAVPWVSLYINERIIVLLMNTMLFQSREPVVSAPFMLLIYKHLKGLEISPSRFLKVLCSTHTPFLSKIFINYRCEELLHAPHAVCVSPAPSEGGRASLTARKECQRLCNPARVGGRVEPVWLVFKTVRGGV